MESPYIEQIFPRKTKVSKWSIISESDFSHQVFYMFSPLEYPDELFSWFESKSRINFLNLLRAGHCDYHLNGQAITYMEASKLPEYVLKKVTAHLGRIFADDIEWKTFLADHDIDKANHIKIVTEGALIGAIVEHGISEKLAIVSDDAGQFNILLHALCWLHAERTLDKIIPLTPKGKEDLSTVKDQIWQLYQDLKLYKENPKPKDKKRLEETFDQIFTTKTNSASLNEALILLCHITEGRVLV